MDESESAAAEVERLRRLRETAEESPPEEQTPPPRDRRPQRRTFAELVAPLVAAWRALAANVAGWPGAIRSWLGSISPRTVGLTLRP